MNNKIHDAFSKIKASDDLKNSTTFFLHQQIDRQSKRTRHALRRSVAGALAVFMVFFGIGGYSAWATPVSYISVDVNPSVELSLNRFDRVIYATDYSEEGELVLDGISLKGKTYAGAIDALLYSEVMSRYLSQDPLLSFTVVSDRTQEIIAGISTSSSYKQYGGVCESADQSLMQEAHKNRVSFGKYKIYLLLSEYDKTNTFEYYRSFTMRQLDDMLKAYGIENPSNGGFGPGSGEGNGSGKGNQGEYKGF